MARRNRIHRQLGIWAALALIAVALAIPAAASAYTVAGGFTGAGSTSAQQVVLHRDGSQAVPFDATPSGTSATAPSDGFNWGDAMIGAGAAIAVLALIGAGGLTVRSRRHVAHAGQLQ